MLKHSYTVIVALVALLSLSTSADALTLRVYTNAGSGELHLTLEEESGAAVSEFPFLVVEGLQWQAATSASGPGTPLDEFLGNQAVQGDVGLSLGDVATDLDPGAQQLAPGSPYLLLVFVSPGNLADILPAGAPETYLGSVLINGDETNPELGFLDETQEALPFELIVLPEPTLASLLSLSILGAAAVRSLRQRA